MYILTVPEFRVKHAVLRAKLLKNWHPSRLLLTLAGRVRLAQAALRAAAVGAA
jgi:hypothetical protein